MEKMIGRFNFILILLISIVIISCNNKEASKFRVENDIEFDTIRTAKRHHIEGDSKNPYCDIRIEFVYPKTSKETELKTIQQFFVKSIFGGSFEELEPEHAIEAYVSNYFKNYSKDADTYRGTVTDMNELNALIPGIDIHDSEHVMSDMFYSYFESLSDSITFNQYDIISFQVKQSNSKGEPNSFYVSYRNYVLNLNTGNQILEGDIFIGGYDYAMQNIIITTLIEQNDVETLEDLEDIGYFGVREIVPNKNFLINDKGITYTFNKGEYSAYQLDAPEVFIPFNIIRPLLRENTIISKLANL
jgi:hypothetical protein